MATHSSTLAWKIPWMEEPGGLPSMGSLRVGHYWATWLSLFTFMHWRRKWQPTPVFLPGESQGRGSLVGCLLWVSQNWTQLKWLSSSSYIEPISFVSQLFLSWLSYSYKLLPNFFFTFYILLPLSLPSSPFVFLGATALSFCCLKDTWGGGNGR